VVSKKSTAKPAPLGVAQRASLSQPIDGPNPADGGGWDAKDAKGQRGKNHREHRTTEKRNISIRVAIGGLGPGADAGLGPGRRLASFLQRRGYDWVTVSRVLKRVGKTP